MRVLSFSSSFPSRANPASGVFVHRRLRALAEHVDLTVVHPVPWFPLYRPVTPGSSCRQEEIEGLAVHHPRFFYLPGVLKRFDGWFYCLGLSRWLRRHIRAAGRPDVLDAHFAWPDGVGVSYLARRLDLPYVITLRGTINPRYQVPCFRRRMADALRGASAVISVSRAMASIAVELGADERKVHVIPNGVDTSMFSPMPRAEARRRLGLPEWGPLIVSVASLKPDKGHGEVIEALSRLPKDAHLVIVGAETDRGAYLRSLKSRLREDGLTGRVTFEGPQPHSTMPQYFNAADVSVLASHHEGCPNVVLESLACGTPVVATAVGGVPDLVRPGQNGELVPVNASGVLADALATALDKEWSREAIRETVAGRSWGSVAREVLEVLETAA